MGSVGLIWVHVVLGSPTRMHPISPGLEGLAGSGQVAQRCPKSAGVIFCYCFSSFRLERTPPCWGPSSHSTLSQTLKDQGRPSCCSVLGHGWPMPPGEKENLRRGESQSSVGFPQLFPALFISHASGNKGGFSFCCPHYFLQAFTAPLCRILLACVLCHGEGPYSWFLPFVERDIEWKPPESWRLKDLER